MAGKAHPADEAGQVLIQAWTHFITLSILVFNFYPMTAVMIVLLALLNDGAILSIAYDKVHYRNNPEAWNMRTVLGLATVLGIAGVIASFGTFTSSDLG